ncbi:Innexin unc-7 [Armadillidium nasatum]|uniref:Innexin n=1 Tax=Armadillidium nasatum TaxID=96803 RepID=A0A5N5TEN3_9CRUS|nr:Innexin unc-7 [Armadillidium nasatum]
MTYKKNSKMADLFRSLNNFFKIDEIVIDNNIFKLHYKVTGVLLITCSLLVTERQYLGDPIDCITDKVPAELMDTYCWIHSTYTVTNLSNAKVGVDIPHPGVAPPLDHYNDTERQYHKYYQWVTLVLFLQALMFYIPHYLWKTWERKTIKNLVMHLNLPVFDENSKEVRKQILSDYYIKNLHEFKSYTFRFFFCEVLNMVNVLLQLYLTNLFLDGAFTTYGTRVVEFSRQKFGTRLDPMDEVFPKVTKCTFYKYGPSGTVQRVDGLCVLPINAHNPGLHQWAKNMDPLIFAEIMDTLSEKSEAVYAVMYETADTLPSKRRLRNQLTNDD